MYSPPCSREDLGQLPGNANKTIDRYKKIARPWKIPHEWESELLVVAEPVKTPGVAWKGDHCHVVDSHSVFWVSGETLFPLAPGALKELIYLAPDKREVSKGESLKDTAVASSGSVPHRTAQGSIHWGQPTWTIPDPQRVSMSSVLSVTTGT